jgi:hypothetical protein
MLEVHGFILTLDYFDAGFVCRHFSPLIYYYYLLCIPNLYLRIAEINYMVKYF